MATKRTAHTFGDETGDSLEPRERSTAVALSQPATKAASSVVSAGDSIKSVSMEPGTTWTSASSDSSRASISSSTNSSTLSTPPDAIFNNTMIPSLLPEAALLPEPGIDAIAMMPGGPPINFGTILPGLYRSSYPKPENYDFLKQLGLKSIVTLVDKNFTEGYGQFMAENHIQHHMFSMKGTKKEDIPLPTMQAILTLVLDRRNYPMLIHCNHGKHRTGCVAAVVRKVAGWDTDTIVDEYRAYAGRKLRDCDVAYIRAFNLASMGTILTNPDLDIRDLCEKANGGSMGMPLGPLVPANAALRFRVPSFFRATFFSMTVLFIWMLSGFKMTPNRR